MNTKYRKNPPTKPTRHGDELSYVVWSRREIDGVDDPWCIAAAFRYLQECLDFIAYCQDRGATVIFQSPTGCKSYGPQDSRVVFKPA